MSWLLPSALAIAGVAAAGAILLHFISRSRPMAEPLPTARFIPPRPIRARARSLAFSDLPLLLLRIAAIAAVGAAVAGPLFASARARVARVIVADRSRTVASVREARDSVRTLLRRGDALVVFDSAAVSATSPDSIAASAARGSLSAGLARAMRVASAMSGASDSIELVLVSPIAAEEADAATDSIRAAWPGRIRLVRIAAARAPAESSPRVEMPRDESDALVAGLTLAGVFAPNGWIRLSHGVPSAADSVWAREPGHVLLVWPHDARGSAWPQRATVDAIGGVTSESGTLIARFPRVWRLSGRVVARWSDGEAAAVEHAAGRGCIRDVGVLIDPASDVTLRQSFRDFTAALLAPCGGRMDDASLGAAASASLAGAGPLAAAASIRPSRGQASSWAPWLLALAAALLTIELAVRRSERRTT